MTTTDINLIDRCRRANGLAYQAMMKSVAEVDADFRAGIRPSPNFEMYERRSTRVWETAKVVAFEAEVGQHIATPDGILVKADHVGFENHIAVDLTMDGRPINLSSWHVGDSDSAHWVQYERLCFDPETGELESRSHGFVDTFSRRLVQAG